MNKIINENITKNEKNILVKWINEVQNDFRKIDLNFDNYDLTFAVSKRLKTTLGKCRKTWSKYADKKAYITINYNLIKNNYDKLAKNTIAHELIHALQNTYGHNTEFYGIANKVNHKLDGYKISRCSNDEKAIKMAEEHRLPVKYIITCTKCGNKITRRKNTKVIRNIENYRCYQCNGKLEVEKV